MKRGQIIEGRIVRVDYPNVGILEADGREVKVKDALPGQTVRARVSKARRGGTEARLTEVVERADNEVASDCCHFPGCGGCSWRTLPEEAQLRLKEDEIRRLLAGALRGTAWEDGAWFEGIRPAPHVYGYRNKMEFSFGDEFRDGPLALGMHRRGSFYDIVTTDKCRIADGDFGAILRCTLDFAAGTGEKHFHKISHEGYFRHLLIRRGEFTGEILVDLVTTTQAQPEPELAACAHGRPDGTSRPSPARPEPDLTAWVEALRALPLQGTITGILHTYNDSVADALHFERTEVLFGRDYIYEELLGLRFRITPQSFFQTNSAGAEVLYSAVREYAGGEGGRDIFDLYSGTGTIAQILAPVARRVTGIEIVPEAVEDARANAELNGLGNCHFLCGDVLAAIDELRDEKPDLIVLDPPREGIHPKALPKILAYGVDRLIYISCKATSLARDLGPILQAGYRPERGCAVELFCGTSHVETVVLLSKV